MRKIFLLSMLCSIVIFSSCSKNKEDEPQQEPELSVYESLAVDKDGVPYLKTNKYPSRELFEQYLIGHRWVGNVYEHENDVAYVNFDGSIIPNTDGPFFGVSVPFLKFVDEQTCMRGVPYFFGSPVISLWEERTYTYDPSTGWFSDNKTQKLFRILEINELEFITLNRVAYADPETCGTGCYISRYLRIPDDEILPWEK